MARYFETEPGFESSQTRSRSIFWDLDPEKQDQDLVWLDPDLEKTDLDLVQFWSEIQSYFLLFCHR